MYKVLLTGRHVSLINDFFAQMMNTLDPMTTSMRFDDLVIHLNYFHPDIFIYCMNKESADDMTRIVNLVPRLQRENIPFALIGDSADCDEFNRMSPRYADLTLTRPIATSVIEEKLLEFLKKNVGEPDMSMNFGMETIGNTGIDTGMNPDINTGAPAASDRTSYQNPIQTPPAPKPVARKHILVVDDDYRILKIVKDHLHDKYDIATAPNGKLARKFLMTKTTDLILLDYQMPDEDGPAVLEQLRQDPLTMDIPVVFLTGVTDRSKIAKALVLKPQGYLLKPIDRDKLMELIANIFGEA